MKGKRIQGWDCNTNVLPCSKPNGPIKSHLHDIILDRKLRLFGMETRHFESIADPNVYNPPSSKQNCTADDVIVSYGGQSILSFNDLTRAIREGDPGESVRVAIMINLG